MTGRATLEARGSVIENSHDVGVFVAGSDALFADLTIRRTVPPPGGERGRGLDVEASYIDGISAAEGTR